MPVTLDSGRVQSAGTSACTAMAAKNGRLLQGLPTDVIAHLLRHVDLTSLELLVSAMLCEWKEWPALLTRGIYLRILFNTVQCEATEDSKSSRSSEHMQTNGRIAIYFYRILHARFWSTPPQQPTLHFNAATPSTPDSGEWHRFHKSTWQYCLHIGDPYCLEALNAKGKVLQPSLVSQDPLARFGLIPGDEDVYDRPFWQPIESLVKEAVEIRATKGILWLFEQCDRLMSVAQLTPFNDRRVITEMDRIGIVAIILPSIKAFRLLFTGDYCLSPEQWQQIETIVCDDHMWRGHFGTFV